MFEVPTISVVIWVWETDLRSCSVSWQDG